MKLNVTEVNDYLHPLLGQHEDSFQEAWVNILECNPGTLEEITPIVRRVRNKAIKQYMNKKHREQSLYKPIGKNGDETFTLESILQSPGNENPEDAEDRNEGGNGLYRKIVDFLLGEYFNLRNENLQLKKRDIELKAERLRLRAELRGFRRDRFESWKKLMENRTRQKERQFTLKIRLQREKLEFRKEQLYLKEKESPPALYLPRVSRRDPARGSFPDRDSFITKNSSGCSKMPRCKAPATLFTCPLGQAILRVASRRIRSDFCHADE